MYTSMGIHMPFPPKNLGKLSRAVFERNGFKYLDHWPNFHFSHLRGQSTDLTHDIYCLGGPDTENF